MIVDTSVIVAIGLEEPDADVLIRAMRAANHLVMSAGTLVETRIVAFGKGGDRLLAAVGKTITEFSIEIVPVSAHQADLATTAFKAFGRGSGHLAKLNFSDCFTYALAAELNEVILCKGDDLIHTDREVVRGG